MENQMQQTTIYKETLFSEIVEIKKLIYDIETEDICNFNPMIILPVLKSLIDAKQNQYFAN